MKLEVLINPDSWEKDYGKFLDKDNFRSNKNIEDLCELFALEINKIEDNHVNLQKVRESVESICKDTFDFETYKGIIEQFFLHKDIILGKISPSSFHLYYSSFLHLKNSFELCRGFFNIKNQINFVNENQIQEEFKLLLAKKGFQALWYCQNSCAYTIKKLKEDNLERYIDDYIKCIPSNCYINVNIAYWNLKFYNNMKYLLKEGRENELKIQLDLIKNKNTLFTKNIESYEFPEHIISNTYILSRLKEISKSKVYFSDLANLFERFKKMNIENEFKEYFDFYIDGVKRNKYYTNNINKNSNFVSIENSYLYYRKYFSKKSTYKILKESSQEIIDYMENPYSLIFDKTFFLKTNLKNIIKLLKYLKERIVPEKLNDIIKERSKRYSEGIFMKADYINNHVTNFMNSISIEDFKEYAYSNLLKEGIDRNGIEDIAKKLGYIKTISLSKINSKNKIFFVNDNYVVKLIHYEQSEAKSTAEKENTINYLCSKNEIIGKHFAKSYTKTPFEVLINGEKYYMGIQENVNTKQNQEFDNLLTSKNKKHIKQYFKEWMNIIADLHYHVSKIMINKNIVSPVKDLYREKDKERRWLLSNRIDENKLSDIASVVQSVSDQYYINGDETKNNRKGIVLLDWEESGWGNNYISLVKILTNSRLIEKRMLSDNFIKENLFYYLNRIKFNEEYYEPNKIKSSKQINNNVLEVAFRNYKLAEALVFSSVGAYYSLENPSLNEKKLGDYMDFKLEKYHKLIV